LPFPFVGAELRTVHTPAIGGKRAYMGKAPDIARFSQNCLGEHRPDARDRLQQPV
jgi:hypothetical protein